jgi:hypothetical protein
MRKLMAIVAFFAVANCLTAQNISGKWAREKDILDTPTSLILNNDGTYEISRGTWSVRGEYKVKDGIVSFFDTAGDDMDSCRGYGKYTASLSNDVLNLTIIEDRATYRNFTLTNVRWTRITPTETTTYIRK